MTSEEINLFRFAIAVAAVCMEDERPPAAEMTQERACEYISGILEMALAHTGVTFKAYPMQYPKCSKIPIIISFDRIGKKLFWFYPDSDISSIAEDLLSVVQDPLQCAMRVTA